MNILIAKKTDKKVIYLFSAIFPICMLRVKVNFFCLKLWIRYFFQAEIFDIFFNDFFMKILNYVFWALVVLTGIFSMKWLKFQWGHKISWSIKKILSLS